MKVASFFLCLAKWLAVPLIFAIVGYYVVVPRLQRDLEATQAKDEARLTGGRNQGNAEFQPPKLDVLRVKKGASVSSNIRIYSGGSRTKKKKVETPATDVAGPVSAPTAPISKPESDPASTPGPPPTPDPAPTGGGETIPVTNGDGGGGN